MNRGYFFIACTTVLFSSMEIALKGVTGQFNPIQMTLTRFFIGGLALIPFAIRSLRMRGVSLPLRSLFDFAWLGFLGILVSMTFYQLAVENANASVVAVLFSCNTVFVLLFAFFLLQAEIRRLQIIALLLQILGSIALINPLNTEISAAGIIFTLLATVTFALYGVMGTPHCARSSGVVVTCGSFLFGSFEMLILVGLSHLPPVASFLSAQGLALFAEIPLLSGYSADNALWMLYICIAVTGGGYACYFMAMEVTSPVTASMVFFFKPVLAPILAWLILHEAIPFNMIVGIALILFGSFFSLLAGMPHARLFLYEKVWTKLCPGKKIG